LLLDLEPFVRVGAAGRALLASRVVRRRIGRGTSVLRRDQTVAGAYFVLSGRLRVFTVAPNGIEATLYFIDPGETCVLALNCLFNDLRYPAWVQAEAAATIAQIPGPVYRRLFDTEPAIRNVTVEALSTVVFRLMAELEQVHASDHRSRLAHFLVLHATMDGAVRMTQQHVARHLGTTREVVARSLGDFVRRDVVRTQRGLIQVRDVAGLRRIASAGRSPRVGRERSDER
jgi:CRP/FNR family transcriptional regulator